MTGAITFSTIGEFDISGGSLKSAMDAQNCGAATAGAETTSFQIVPVANGKRVAVFKFVRAA